MRGRWGEYTERRGRGGRGLRVLPLGFVVGMAGERGGRDWDRSFVVSCSAVAALLREGEE